MTISKRFHGIVPPVVTPFVKGKPGMLDKEALARIITRMVNNGVTGVFVLGTNGEQQSLGMAQRREALAVAGPLVKERALFYVGISDNSYDDIEQNIAMAAKFGADCLVIHPPSYFKLNPAELMAFFRKVAEMSPLPVILYNIGLAGQLIPYGVVRELSQAGNIVGIKDSSGDMRYFYRLTEDFAQQADFSVFCGNDVLIADALRNGADGGVPGGANFLPQIICGLYQAHLRGDYARFDAIREIIRGYDRLFWLDESPCCFLKAAKYALGCQGLCSDECLPPVGRIADDVKTEIERLVQAAMSAYEKIA